MKNSRQGFTLVELLIVIALIAILAVAVLATINPIEQTNKARDAKVQNDAAEVLSAYERYYASKSSYPWIDIEDSTVTSVDAAVALSSNLTGFGLCGNTVNTGEAVACSSATTPGLLVSNDELKASFLNKTYTVQAGAAAWQDRLYLVKQGAADGNNVYVCFMPKAKANRSNTANFKLKALNFSDLTSLPMGIVDATAAQITAAQYTTLADNDTLFRCVPE